jgi:poly(hydroxyalkanoate) depolymerase family esterase
MIEKTIGAHGIDRGQVFVTGLSAGGAMAAAMLATYPEVFAAGAIIAGLPYGTASNVQEAFESMFQGKSHIAKVWGDLVRRASSHRGPWPRVSIWHGDADATVRPINADGLIAQWTDVHGIDTAPGEDNVDGYPRKVWRRDGVDLVESYTITGMAHGTTSTPGKGLPSIHSRNAPPAVET